MNIYLAARYDRYPELQLYAEDLRTLGHTVTSRWHNGDHAAKDSLAENVADFNRRIAEDDYEDLMSADCVIAFTEGPISQRGSARGGRHVELGLAIASNKRLYVCGPRENVFCWLPQVEQCDDWGAVLASLATLPVAV